MENKKTNLPKALGWVSAGLAVVGIAWLLFFKDKDKNLLESMRSAASSFGSGFKCTSKEYPLNYGTCHPDVAKLQRYLKMKGADLGDGGPNKDGADGKFGKTTRKEAIRLLRSDQFGKSFIDKLKV